MDLTEWLQLLTTLMSLTFAMVTWIVSHILKVEKRITRLETINHMRRKSD